jgi:hypothetical protein
MTPKKIDKADKQYKWSKAMQEAEKKKREDTNG